MINITQIADLIERVCNKLGRRYATQDAVELLIGTAIIESRFKYLKQLGGGPASGFWQIESDTAIDNCNNWLKFRPTTRERCVKATYVPLRYWSKPNKSEWEFILETNIAASIIHARIKYYRIPKPIPKTLEGKAQYWKQWFNTPLGAGEESEYIEQVSKYI